MSTSRVRQGKLSSASSKYPPLFNGTNAHLGKGSHLFGDLLNNKLETNHLQTNKKAYMHMLVMSFI